MDGLGFFSLGIQLLTGPLEVVHYGQDFAQGGAGDLGALILLIAALALAEVVEIRGDPHVLTADGLVLSLEGGQFGLELADTLLRVGTGFSGHLSRRRIHLSTGFWGCRGLSWGRGGVLGKRSRGAAHADRTGDLI